MPVLVPSTAGQRASALTTPLPRSIPQAIAGWWFDLLLLLPLIPLYLLPNYAYNYDGVIYSGYVRHGDWSQMVHPHHLAYMPALHGLSRLLEGWGLSPHPYELLSILSRVSGLAALLVVGHGFRRLAFPDPRAIGATWLIGAGCAFWQWSTIAGVYLPTAVLLYVLYFQLAAAPAGPLPRAFLAKAAGLFLVALLLHQMVALLWPGLVVWAALRSLRGNRLREALRTGAWLGLPPLAAYLLTYAALHRLWPSETLWTWAIRYGQVGSWWVWQQGWESGHPLREWLLRYGGSHLKLLWGLPNGEHFTPAGGVGVPAVVFAGLGALLFAWLVAAAWGGSGSGVPTPAIARPSRWGSVGPSPWWPSRRSTSPNTPSTGSSSGRHSSMRWWPPGRLPPGR